MRRVASHVSAAVGAGLFNCYLAGGRSHLNKLFGHNLGIFYDFAVSVTVPEERSMSAFSRIIPSALTAIGSTREIVSASLKFWITPPLTSKTEIIRFSGSRIRIMILVRSTQRLPKPSVLTLIKPRMKANSKQCRWQQTESFAPLIRLLVSDNLTWILRCMPASLCLLQN